MSGAWGQNLGRKTSVAVLAFAGDNNVNSAQLDFITSKFVGELISLDVFNVLDRGKMDYILQEQGFQQSGACNSNECKVEMGQLLGMDYIISGYLLRFGKSYALSIEYTDLGTGRIVKTFDDRKTGELDEIYESLCHSVAAKLVQFADPTRAAVVLAEPIKTEPAQIEPTSVVNKIVATTTEVASAPQTKAESQVNYKPEPVTRKPMSWGKKVAIGLGGVSLGGVAAGLYAENQSKKHLRNVDEAFATGQRELSFEAWDKAKNKL